MVPRDGEAVFDGLPEIRARETGAGQRVGATMPPSPESFGVEHPADIAWVGRHLTPMPSMCDAERIQLANAAAQEIPQTYLLCAAQPEGALRAVTEAAYERFRSSDRGHRQLPGPQAIMVTHPEVLAESLLSPDQHPPDYSCVCPAIPLLLAARLFASLPPICRFAPALGPPSYRVVSSTK
jgi:hypothetical protein